MKKILTHLTGIVILFSILIANSCQSAPEQEGTAPKEEGATTLLPTSKDVDVFLKEKLIDERMHLEMYDSRDTTKKKVDSLYTLVYPESIVTWKKAAGSKIKAVHQVRLMEADSSFSFSKDSIGLMSLYTLVIPINPNFDTIKYEIIFEDKDGEFWYIDPYLRIED